AEYLDEQGKPRPQYELTKTECLYIATKFNDEARARLVLRWEALENERLKNYIQIPKSISVFGMEALPYDWWLLQNGYSVSSGQRSRRIKKHPEHFYKGTKGWYINKLYAEALLNIKLGKERLQQVQALPQLNQLEMF
ncbi:antA/AntB antirepressor family protein, partial [Ornithobacterium rhinotracheale]